LIKPTAGRARNSTGDPGTLHTRPRGRMQLQPPGLGSAAATAGDRQRQPAATASREQHRRCRPGAIGWICHMTDMQLNARHGSRLVDAARAATERAGELGRNACPAAACNGWTKRACHRNAIAPR
jgi:hypothetical protein